MTMVVNNSIYGTFSGGVLGAISMGNSLIANQSVKKAENEAKKHFQQREEERFRRDSLTQKGIILWGVCVVMEWVSYAPNSPFAKAASIFSVFGRSLSCALSGLRVYGSVKDLIYFSRLSEIGKTAKIREQAHVKFVLSSINMLAEMCFLGYFALQLASALLGFAVASGLYTLMIIAGIILLIGAFIFACVSAIQAGDGKKSETKNP